MTKEIETYDDVECDETLGVPVVRDDMTLEYWSIL